MTLSNAILFPGAMLPLYIFEPRYRQMLDDCLRSHRMFTVAMRKPGSAREIPSPVAGVGIIRASVRNKDGTSHLVLQGIARVKLGKAVRYKPYRVQRIAPLETTSSDSVAVDALAAKVIELVGERLEQGVSLPAHLLKSLGKHWEERLANADTLPLHDVLQQLSKVENADFLADLVSCTLLPEAAKRQTILETPNLEDRLKHLIHFLLEEIHRARKGKR